MDADHVIPPPREAINEKDEESTAETSGEHSDDWLKFIGQPRDPLQRRVRYRLGCFPLQHHRFGRTTERHGFHEF